MFARVAMSGECLRGEGLVWLIGAVVCLLAACRGSNCTLMRAVDGCNLHCSTIGSCQSTASSKNDVFDGNIKSPSQPTLGSHLYLADFVAVSAFFL